MSVIVSQTLTQFKKKILFKMDQQSFSFSLLNSVVHSMHKRLNGSEFLGFGIAKWCRFYVCPYRKLYSPYRKPYSAHIMFHMCAKNTIIHRNSSIIKKVIIPYLCKLIILNNMSRLSTSLIKFHFYYKLCS